MKHRRVALAAGIAATWLLLGAAKQPARMGNAPLYAIGVVTPDIEETRRQYERILGVVPEDFGTPSVEEPNGESVTLKMYVVFFPNFYIKLQQPISPNGPYADHLREHGMSIENAQLQVPDFKAVRSGLARKGRWTLGTEADHWAYVDFQQELGTTLEPTAFPGVERPVTPSPGASFPPLGSMPVTHVGIAVADARKAARSYKNVFGIPMPRMRTERVTDYPPGIHAGREAHLRIAEWQQGGVGMELIQSVGAPTPWSEHVRKHRGNAAYSITIDVGDRLEDTLADLRAKGGKWINGRPGGDFAYVDFSDTLGLVIKITGTPATPSP